MSYMYEDIFERGMERGRSEGIQLGRNEGIQLSRNEGIQSGIARGISSVVRGMLSLGNISYEDIAKCSGMSIDEIKRMAKQ